MKTHTKRLSISTLLTIFIAVFTGNVLSSSVANANSFSLTSSSGGTLYLQSFDADKREFNYLIDTGSSLTILNKATFNVFAAQQNVTEEGVVIAKLANGKKHKVKLYIIPTLALSADCHFDNVKVAVMDNQHNILGMEVLGRAAPFGIQMSPPTLTLHQCDDDISSELLAKSPAKPAL